MLRLLVNMEWSIPTKLGWDAAKVGEGAHHMSACWQRVSSTSVICICASVVMLHFTAPTAQRRLHCVCN